MTSRGSKWKQRSLRFERHRSGQCAVCGPPVMWASRMDLGHGRVTVLLCRVHQQAFGLDHPPEPPLPKL
jgi:hypothetical protein